MYQSASRHRGLVRAMPDELRQVEKFLKAAPGGG